MIYDGESVRSNGSTFTADTSAFNPSHNDNMYVGFKYTSGQVHGISTKSTILETLETWYNNNLENYASKLDLNAGFCGDRRSNTTTDDAPNGTGGTGTTETYYAARYRLYVNKTPELSCETADFYTVSGANKGNKSLTYPIGLITADEVAIAGGVWSTANKSYYLYTGQIYWTMSPSTDGARVFRVYSDGNLNYYLVHDANGVRPVINLKADILFYGNGTMDNPYVVID